MRAIPALFVVAILLAGCVEQKATPPSEFVAAGALRSQADAKAMAWDANATLQTISTVEVPNLGMSNATTNGTGFPMDPMPGDGLAKEWEFRYFRGVGPDADTYMVRLSSNGTVMETEERGYDSPLAPTPLGNWTLDSDAAATVARANATIQAALSENATFVSMGIFRLDANQSAVWAYAVAGKNMNASVAVNADTGNVSSLEEYFLSIFPRTEMGAFSGRLTVAENSASHPFAVMDSDHPYVVVYVSAPSGPHAPGTVAVTITPPSGTATQFNWMAPPVGAGRTGRLVEPAPAGDWSIGLSLTTGALVDYSLTWCAYGIDENFQVLAACEAPQ